MIAFARMLKDYSVFSFVPKHWIQNWFVLMLLFSWKWQYPYENPLFDLLVWGSLRLAPIVPCVRPVATVDDGIATRSQGTWSNYRLQNTLMVF